MSCANRSLVLHPGSQTNRKTPEEAVARAWYRSRRSVFTAVNLAFMSAQCALSAVRSILARSFGGKFEVSAQAIERVGVSTRCHQMKNVRQGNSRAVCLRRWLPAIPASFRTRNSPGISRTTKNSRGDPGARRIQSTQCADDTDLSRRAEVLATYCAEYEGVDWDARYNIFPNQNVPVIRQDKRIFQCGSSPDVAVANA
jgi:hypothetical protein